MSYKYEKTVETFKISDLIRRLQAVKKEIGDRPVALASDYELNHFGNVTYKSFVAYDNMLVICPVRSQRDIEEFIDYVCPEKSKWLKSFIIFDFINNYKLNIKGKKNEII